MENIIKDNDKNLNEFLKKQNIFKCKNGEDLINYLFDINKYWNEYFKTNISLLECIKLIRFIRSKVENLENMKIDFDDIKSGVIRITNDYNNKSKFENEMNTLLNVIESTESILDLKIEYKSESSELLNNINFCLVVLQLYLSINPYNVKNEEDDSCKKICNAFKTFYIYKSNIKKINNNEKERKINNNDDKKKILVPFLETNKYENNNPLTKDNNDSENNKNKIIYENKIKKVNEKEESIHRKEEKLFEIENDLREEGMKLKKRKEELDNISKNVEEEKKKLNKNKTEKKVIEQIVTKSVDDNNKQQDNDNDDIQKAIKLSLMNNDNNNRTTSNIKKEVKKEVKLEWPRKNFIIEFNDFKIKFKKLSDKVINILEKLLIKKEIENLNGYLTVIKFLKTIISKSFDLVDGISVHNYFLDFSDNEILYIDKSNPIKNILSKVKGLCHEYTEINNLIKKIDVDIEKIEKKIKQTEFDLKNITNRFEMSLNLFDKTKIMFLGIKDSRNSTMVTLLNIRVNGSDFIDFNEILEICFSEEAKNELIDSLILYCEKRNKEEISETQNKTSKNNTFDIDIDKIKQNDLHNIAEIFKFKWENYQSNVKLLKNNSNYIPANFRNSQIITTKQYTKKWGNKKNSDRLLTVDSCFNNSVRSLDEKKKRKRNEINNKEKNLLTESEKKKRKITKDEIKQQRNDKLMHRLATFAEYNY